MEASIPQLFEPCGTGRHAGRHAGQTQANHPGSGASRHGAALEIGPGVLAWGLASKLAFVQRKRPGCGPGLNSQGSCENLYCMGQSLARLSFPGSITCERNHPCRFGYHKGQSLARYILPCLRPLPALRSSVTIGKSVLVFPGNPLPLLLVTILPANRFSYHCYFLRFWVAFSPAVNATKSLRLRR